MHQFKGIKQGTKEWLQARSNLITATNVGIILNMNPFERKTDLLKQKIEGNNKFINNQAVKHGQFFEDVAKKIYEKKTKNKIYTPGLNIHSRHNWLGASPDGIVNDSHLVEFKCYYSKKITDSIPIYYWMQMQIQMEVCDYNKCDFVECIFKKVPKKEFQKNSIYEKGIHNSVHWLLCDFKITEVHRNKIWFQQNLPQLKLFWDLVLYYKQNQNSKKRKRSYESLTYNNINFNNFYYYKKIDNYILDDSIIDYFSLKLNYRQDKSLFNFQNKERKYLFIHDLMNHFNNLELITGYHETPTYEKYEQTIKEIHKKRKNLFGAILFDFTNQIYCKYDLLILGKDLLSCLPDNLSLDLFADSYYPIQIINRNIKVFAHTINVTNDNTNKKYKARSIILNNLLNSVQQHANNQKSFIVDKTFLNKKQYLLIEDTDELSAQVTKGIAFYKKIKENLDNINVENPELSEIKLIPNMKNQNPFWISEKKKIAKLINPITSIWYCSIHHQNFLMNQNIYSYKDPNINFTTLFDKYKVNANQSNIIKKFIKINSQSKDLIYPSKFANVDNWKYKPKVEFYVDFETTTLLDSTRVLYMIGLGVRVYNKWEYYSFCIDVNKENAEKYLVLDWIYKMNQIKRFHNIRKNIIVWHWSNAEKAIFKSITQKYPEIQVKINWKDLQEIFVEEQIVIKDAYNYKLKSIVGALSKHKLIESSYKDLVCDNGVDAMVDGYNCYMNALRMNVDISHYLEEKNIIEYNRMDCYSLYDILKFLRTL